MATNSEIRAYLEKECLGIESVIAPRERDILVLQGALDSALPGTLVLVVQRAESLLGECYGMGAEAKPEDYHLIRSYRLGLHQPPGIQIQGSACSLTTSAWIEMGREKPVQEGSLTLNGGLDFLSGLTWLGRDFPTRNPIYSHPDRHGRLPIALEVIVGDAEIQEWIWRSGQIGLLDDFAEAAAKLGKPQIISDATLVNSR